MSVILNSDESQCKYNVGCEVHNVFAQIKYTTKRRKTKMTITFLFQLSN